MMNALMGTVIGGITVILLLSLLVTGIMQALSALLKLRAEGLAYGLFHLFEKVLPANVKSSAKSLTEHAIDYIAMDGVKRRVHSVDVQELKAAVVHLTQPGQPFAQLGLDVLALQNELQQRFARFEALMSDRFTSRMRVISFLVSFAVAALTQVSLPDLMIRLHQDESFRQHWNTVASELLESSRVNSDGAAFTLSQDELEAIQKRQIANNDDAAIQQAVQNLRVDDAKNFIEDAHQHVAVLGESGKAVAAVLESDVRQVQLDKAREAIANSGLSYSVSATFWQCQTGPMCEMNFRFDRLLGVLLTAMLMMAGAPFWFEQLKNVASLRDAFSRKK